MPGRIEKIVVTGDVTIDWLMWRVKPEDPKDQKGKTQLNWQLFCGTRMAARPGGALLLAKLIWEATGHEVEVAAPELPPGIENIGPQDVLHSMVLLEKYPLTADLKSEETLIYRVKENLGYAGPPTGGAARRPAVEPDEAGAGLVVLDDAGNGFRDQGKWWPLAITTQDRTPLVILKMSRPLMDGELWRHLTSTHAKRLVVVISADDLRAEEVNIPRRLSWERTATDFFWQMMANRKLSPLAACRHLIVRFGLDGAVHYRSQGGQPEATLYYDPVRLEDGFTDEHQGSMTGMSMAFVAALASQVVKHKGLEGVSPGVHDGLMSARRLLQLGFGPDPNTLDYPSKRVFQPITQAELLIAQVRIPSPDVLHCADPVFWTILTDLTRARLEEVAVNTVITGKDRDLDMVPSVRFGDLKTVDRREIESLRSIQNLMREYLEQSQQKRPLSLAVFGPPGAGKSFAVTQVARSINPSRIEPVELNLSQWSSPDDLIKALHQVRDVVLRGKVPLVFFDEFDAKYPTEELGWLKYFLEPMQDGRFKEGESIHPIGRAIFVFAGGTSTSLQGFSREILEEEENLDAAEKEAKLKELKRKFRDAKGPDFVSRLRGFVDVMGVNPIDKKDRLYKIRRALVLRNMLQRKAPNLFDRAGQLQIQPGVLHALLSASHFTHGVRSLEAILDMSTLAGRRSFEQADLPPAAQLGLHVDAEEFCKLVNREVLLGSRREKLAEAIHESFRESQLQQGRSTNDPAMQPWENLREDFKESNRQQADQMPEKLKAIGYGFRPVIGREPIVVEFAENEVEKLAQMEHDRYVEERLKAGWRFGPRDPEKKTNPTLKPWEELEEEDEREKDRQAVRDIPRRMAEADFEVHRLGE